LCFFKVLMKKKGVVFFARSFVYLI